MNEFRGEKVTFRRQDIVALHSLPSAQTDDPCIVHAPARRGALRGTMHLCVFFLIAFFSLGAIVMGVIEAGMLDRTLNARATLALNDALGDGYHAEVGSTVLRLTGTGSLALKARDVSLVENGSGRRLVNTNSVSIELDPLALFAGRLGVSRLEAEGAVLDPSLLPKGRPIDLTAIRVAHVPDAMEFVFAQVDAISRLISKSKTQVVRVSDLSMSFVGPRNRQVPLVIDKLDFSQQGTGSMQIEGQVSIDGQATQLSLQANRVDGHIDSLDGQATDIPLAPFLFRPPTETETSFGIESLATIGVHARRGDGDGKPVLTLSGALGDGKFNAGGMVSSVKPSTIDLAYDFDRKSIEILPSRVMVGRSSFPFTGAIIDIDQLGDVAKKGVAFDLLLQGASSHPEDVSEQPLIFDAKAQGQFLAETHELTFNELTVSSALGTAAGSLSMTFGDKSPQVSFALLTDRLQSAAVKQLWPWWVGKAARRWVISNIYGGTVTNGRIEIFLDKGRISRTVGPIDLDGQELKVSFNIEDARVNIAGDIPPLRDAKGAFTLVGENMSVDIQGGTAYFPSGRTVSLTGGDFRIPDTYTKPLMAEMKVQVAGQADAIAELVTYRPIEALQHTPFKPEDFTGPMTAQVGARFGLVKAQNPPPPQWQTEMLLNGVTLNKPFAGRDITEINGPLRIDQTQAVLDADARIDGNPMKLSVVEPVGAKSDVKRERSISGTLDSGELLRLVPGLSGIVGGSVGLEVSIDGDNRQTVTADLANASIALPWVGWSKGPGIDAKAQFSSLTTDGVTDITEFDLTGDSFGANGTMQVDKGGLLAASFDRVRLAAGDSYSVGIKRQKSGFSVNVNGSAADVRPILEQIRTASSAARGIDERSARISIDANLDQVKGFHGEGLSGVRLNYVSQDRQLAGLDLSAITDSGQAVVAKLVRNGADNTLELTSGDAGALARFANIYSNMRSGLLNLKLRDRGANSWRGTVDIRKFSIVDEAKLQSIVSTPASADGRSLNQAVKRDIDVSTASFQRGFAQLMLDQGAIRVDNGVVRGSDIGATFQGTVKDRNGNMDMTGTFMPAYGLNRLFGELPLIGALLGNGRDRGLLGITFKLAGSFGQPKLTINPLSIIAPGVFRSIFEFE